MARLGLSKDNLLSRGAARFKDLVYLALQDKKLQKKSVAHTRLGSVDEGEVANVKDLPWRAAGMCVAKLPTERLVVVSGDGAVFTYAGGTEGTETIREAFDLRACASIAGHAYAAGMNRQVFRRAREGTWSAMHAPAAEGKDRVAGFEAIDGFAADDIYAAGWAGELWHWHDRTWTPCTSGVSVVLSAVSCAGDGYVYACGQGGTLLRGRGQEWESLGTKGVTDDLWDVHWFMDRLYVASLTALYVLQRDALVPVAFGRVAPESCSKLTAAEGVLWSIGPKNIFSFDGAAWRCWE